MFSAEDMRRIMEAIATDTKCRQMQQEMDETVNSITGSTTYVSENNKADVVTAEQIAELYNKRNNIGSLLSVSQIADMQKSYEGQKLADITKKLELKYDGVVKLAGDKLTEDDFNRLTKINFDTEYRELLYLQELNRGEN